MDHSNDDDETSSLLDLPGVEEIGKVRSEETKQSSESILEKHSVKPSGSGLTFFLGDEDEDDDDDDEEEFREFEVEDALQDSATSSKIIERTLTQQDEGSHGFQKELTERYISGQLSFNEYIRQIGSDDDEEEEDNEDTKDSEDTDEEWMPSDDGIISTKQPAAAKRSKKNTNEEQPPLKKVHRGGQGGGHKRKKLDPTLQGLMGEANLRFARGDIDTAIKMCMEVIRQDPGAPEPFQTLSTLYEESGEFEKSVQFAVIGAHLVPPDAEEWERLANMSLELNDIRQACYCYKKAIDADSSILKYHYTRCNLLEEIGDKKKALQGFRRLLLSLRPEGQGPEYLEASREVARLLHERGDIESAKNVIQTAINKFPEHIQPEYVNLLLELLISLEEFAEALQTLCLRCGAKFESDVSAAHVASLSHQEQLKVFKSVNLPSDVPIDIIVKLLVVLVNLGAVHLVEPFARQILQYEVSEFGDLMLDTAEAFMSQKCFQEAVKFLEILVHDDEYGKAAVWLQYGECLFQNGCLEEAEKAYQRVVSLAPQHYEARRALSSILHKLGRPDEALTTLTQDEKAELLDPALLFQKCQLLHSEDQTEEFIKKATLLFSRHFVELRSPQEVMAVASTKRLSKKNKGLSEVRAIARSLENPDDSETAPQASFDSESSIKPMEEFKLMRQVCDKLFEQQRYTELQRLTFSSLGSNVFNKHPDIMKECEFLCLLSSFLNGDAHYAYNFVRELVTKDVTNNRLWNLFNTIITSSDDMRHSKFLMRLTTRHPDNVAMGILNGNNCLMSGTYKYSLGEYINVFKVERNNPMVPLMLGIIFVHLACQKFSSRKHSLVVQGCAFLNTYAKLRGHCHETYYNLGRAMQQLSIFPAAIHYYKKVLSIEPPIQDDPNFSLQKEAAFNLSLIYKNSGSEELARQVRYKYIVV